MFSPSSILLQLVEFCQLVTVLHQMKCHASTCQTNTHRQEPSAMTQQGSKHAVRRTCLVATIRHAALHKACAGSSFVRCVAWRKSCWRPVCASSHLTPGKVPHLLYLHPLTHSILYRRIHLVLVSRHTVPLTLTKRDVASVAVQAVQHQNPLLVMLQRHRPVYLQVRTGIALSIVLAAKNGKKHRLHVRCLA